MTAIAGIVLAGGRSARMGTSKAWLDFGGEPMLARVARRVGEAAFPVVVVAAPGQALPPLPAGVEVVRDAAPGRGPLEGLAAGLASIAARADAAFVASTDAPFLHPALIRRLAALREQGHDVIAPRAGGRVHPLGAVYGVSALPLCRSLLAENRLRLLDLLARARTLVADEALLLADEALRAADPGLASLRNVNTPEEYAAALLEGAAEGYPRGP